MTEEKDEVMKWVRRSLEKAKKSFKVSGPHAATRLTALQAAAVTQRQHVLLQTWIHTHAAAHLPPPLRCPPQVRQPRPRLLVLTAIQFTKDNSVSSHTSDTAPLLMDMSPTPLPV